MADVPRLRRNVQVAEVAYKAAVSESTFNKLGGAINFINDRQTMTFEFGLLKLQANSGSPSYSGLTTPFTDFGTSETFPYAAEIIAVTCYHGTAGSSGTTELDIKWQPVNSAAAFATIFSTTPKVTSSAASEVYFDSLGNNTTPTGCTAPVLSKSTFAAGDKIRCDVVSVMGGSPNGFLIRIFFRPI
jgi:hypothetical protein